MELIDLKDGPTLPRAALELALALESRGIGFTQHRETLRVSGGTLTAEDREGITRWKPHLLAIVAYCACNREVGSVE